jgi:hypothetical protein
MADVAESANHGRPDRWSLQKPMRCILKQWHPGSSRESPRRSRYSPSPISPTIRVCHLAEIPPRQLRAMATGGAALVATPFVFDKTAECEDSNHTKALLGVTAAATAGVVYWAFVMESNDLKRVALTPEDRAVFINLLRRTGKFWVETDRNAEDPPTPAGSANPDRELDNIRAQYGKARAPTYRHRSIVRA